VEPPPLALLEAYGISVLSLSLESFGQTELAQSRTKRPGRYATRPRALEAFLTSDLIDAFNRFDLSEIAARSAWFLPGASSTNMAALARVAGIPFGRNHA